MPARRWQRRIGRLGSAFPTGAAAIPDVDPVQLDRLTAAEQRELGRIMAEVERVGLAGLSDADLDRCFALIARLEDETEQGGNGCAGHA